MARSVLSCVLYMILLASGCAAPLLDSAGSAAPRISVVMLRKDATGTLRPASLSAVLGATEEVTLEVSVDRPAYVSTALYSATGTSEELAGDDAATPVQPERPLRIVVARRAPPGVKEPELRVMLVASTVLIPPAIRQLLRLPCGVLGRRGDPEPEKPAKKAPPEDQSSSSSGKPQEGGPRGGATAQAVCASPAELTATIALRALVLHSD